MANFGVWLWLLVNLYNDEQVIQRISKRDVDGAGECPTHESRKFNSFLWALERNPPVYFFGTIHVPYTKVWDHIPANSEQAFYESQNIYFELDLTDPVTLQTLAGCQILPNGSSLRQVIPRSLFKRIRRHLSYVKRIFPQWMTMEQRMMGYSPLGLFTSMTKDWRRKRPIWIMLLLNALNEYDTKSRGTPVLDTFLIREAARWNKKKGPIESVEEQCGPLNALNNSQVIVALNQTLILHEKIRRGKAQMTYSTKELIYHYNCGDLKEVLSAQDLTNVVKIQNSSNSSNREMEEARKLDAYLKEELIYKRNRRMAKRVLKLIEEEPEKKFFFAFGAGHFLGNGSVIDILRSKGHNVTHIRSDDSLPRYGNTRTAKKLKKVRWTRKRGRKRGRRRRRRRQRVRVSNVDNLWKRIDSWTHSPHVSKPTAPSVERTTERIYSSSHAVTDKAHSLAISSYRIATWLVWICVFVIAGQIFH